MISDSLEARLRRWRHHLHQNAETGFDEHRTSDYLADVLTGMGLEVARGIGGTGLVASLSMGTSRSAVGLRADMDALPLTERDGRPYASTTEGVMHACGHDGHMAMLLGAAAALADGGGFDGTVRLVFQPAEEHGRGARAMLDDGLLERFPMDAMYGLHNVPGIPAGHLHTRPGPIMASEDDFELRIIGRGGHAARPHMVVDPVVVAAQIVVALQTIVSRNADPSDGAVVSCTGIETDGARNAIPGEVVIRGDTRSFAPAVQTMIEERMRTLCEGICAAHGATCTLGYTHEFAPTVNDADCAAVAARAASAAVGGDAVDASCQPIMASEDFGIFAQEVPGCFTFIGNGTEPGRGGTALHSRDYDFNDDILSAGVRFHVELVRSVLTPRGPA